MKNGLKITCEESAENIGFAIRKEGVKGNIHWDALTREEQLRILNMLVNGYELFAEHLKAKQDEGDRTTKEDN